MWGGVVEVPGTYRVLIGWDTVEVSVSSVCAVFMSAGCCVVCELT
jgi:hypothetical protein